MPAAPKTVKSRGPRGRRTRLTPTLQAEIVDLVRRGRPYETACAAVKLSTTAFWNWMSEGENPKGRPLYVAFREAVEQAKAAYLGDLIDAATDGTVEDPRHAVDMLARRDRKNWMRPTSTTVELSGPGGAPIQTEAKGVLEGFRDLAHSFAQTDEDDE